MMFTPYEQTNPRAHKNAPYALRHGAGRPLGSYDTVEQAVAQAKGKGKCFVVTRDGWWIVGSVES